MNELKTPHLPKPTGKHAVGTTHYQLTDDSRTNEFYGHPEEKRTITARVWYPTTENKPSTPSGFHSELKAVIALNAGAKKEQLGYLDGVTTHATQEAKIDVSEGPRPVILFSPGFSFTNTLYSSFAQELASHGYVVIGLNHPYSNGHVTLSDGSIKTTHAMYLETGGEQEAWNKLFSSTNDIWSRDMQLALNYLKTLNGNDPNGILTGALDLDKIGVLGHSFGASTAMYLAHQDKRCKALVNLDGMLYGHNITTSINTPALFVFPKRDDANVVWYYPNTERMQQLFDKIDADTYQIILDKTDHDALSDYRILLNPLQAEETVPDPTHVVEIVRSLLLAFFDRYVKGEDTSLEKAAEHYPEVELKTKKR